MRYLRAPLQAAIYKPGFNYIIPFGIKACNVLSVEICKVKIRKFLPTRFKYDNSVSDCALIVALMSELSVVYN
jgi:hypothetical protein